MLRPLIQLRDLFRRKCLALVPIVGVLLSMQSAATETKKQVPDHDPDRIFIFFLPGAISSPDNSVSGPPTAFRFGPQSLPTVLQNMGVTKLERAVPNFEPGKTNARIVGGDAVNLPVDLSGLYIATVTGSVDAALTALGKGRPGIRYAEPIYIRSVNFVPNDSLYWSEWWAENTGQWWGGSAGEDIRLSPAWNKTTGGSVPVGVMDTGVDLDHPDLVPVQAGDFLINPITARDDLAGHGTQCAGIIGARGNNRIGIAGVNWQAYLVNFKVCTDEFTCYDDAIVRGLDLATQSMIPILSASWGKSFQSNSVAFALQNYHAVGGLFVASMGNDNANIKQTPAGYYDTVEAVGAVFRDGTRWKNVNIPGCPGNGGSNYGDWIDITAPGGKMIATTTMGGGYTPLDTTSLDCTQGFSGTSAATPVVAGVASLIKAHSPSLFGEDLAEVMHRTARDKGQTNWDIEYGWGVVDADSALGFVSGSKSVEHGEVGNLTQVAVTAPYQMTIKDSHCVFPLGETIWVRQRELRSWVTFSTQFVEPPVVWARKGQSRGWSSESTRRETERAVGWGGVISGSVTASGCSLFTYVYDILYSYPPSLNYFNCPETVANAKVAYTAVGRVRQDPDITQSFFVPQSGTTGSPSEGTLATKFFRACPNNDGGASLPNNARIKVVIRDAQGNGIAGIAAADINVVFNGGTPQLEPTGQQFRGAGADSIIANSKYNPADQCPDVRTIPADGPTDANGVTYITFTGASGTPGVGQRDASRKWGHWDSEIPVYVYWNQLQGRLTSASSNGSYTLRIRNFDLTYTLGLNALLNTGERVDGGDQNYVANHSLNQPGPINYWADFDDSGAVGATDFNLFNTHVSHDCDNPNSP